jgi:hypothetical protein
LADHVRVPSAVVLSKVITSPLAKVAEPLLQLEATLMLVSVPLTPPVQVALAALSEDRPRAVIAAQRPSARSIGVPI